MLSDSDFDPVTELAFVKRILAREELAIEEFATKLNQRLPRILVSLNFRHGRILSPDDIDDLAQEVRFIVLTKLTSFTGRSQLDAWIYRVAQLEFMNTIRAKRRDPHQTLQEAVDAFEAPQKEDRTNPRERILSAIEQLGGIEADIITTKHFGGLTLREIAEQLEIPLGTAKSRYRRACERLGEILECESQRESR